MPSDIDVSTLIAAEPVVDRLKACTSKAEILDVMTGVPVSVFMLIDEKPGLFPNCYEGDWFAWLRQLRNTPGSGLFEVLT